MTFHAPIHQGTPSRPFISLPRLRPHGPVSDNPARQQDAEVPGIGPSVPGTLSPAFSEPLTRDDPIGAGDLSFLLRPDGSVASVTQARVRQISQGYTLDADGEKTVMQLLDLVMGHARDAQAAWPIAPSRRAPGVLRNALLKLGATTLATIDRLDRGNG